MNIKTVILSITRKQWLPFLLACIFSFLSIVEIQAQQGLKAEYYDGKNFERLVATQYEDKIDHYWNRTPPVEGINPHVCSIRWTGKLRPGKTGTYTFSARVDDGIRVWVDDQLVIDDWHLNDVGIFNGKAYLEAGKLYNLKVEYFNALIEGEVRLLWNIPEGRQGWLSRFRTKKFELIQPQFFLPGPPDQELPTVQEESFVGLDSEVPTKKPVKVQAKRNENKPSKKKVVTNRIEEKPEESKVVEPELTHGVIQDNIPKDILFERTKTNIYEESYKELKRFADFMLKHPELHVKIEGHTDPVGDESKNFQLSERRAYAIASYLVKQGVSHTRISAEGFGGTRPLKMPEDGEYMPRNRRVEFIVSGY